MGKPVRSDDDSGIPNYDELLRIHSPWLLSRVNQRGINLEDGEEIVGDVILQLFRQVTDHGLKSIRNQRAWLSTVLCSKISDFFLHAHR